MRNLVLFVWAALCLTSAGWSQELRLPRIFSDHQVLQREQPIPVWGWAKPNQKVTVALQTKVAVTKADAQGHWSVSLPAMEAGGPYSLMVVSNKDKIELKDVLIGEVWLCSGQSNMEWPLSKANDAAAEISQANYPNMRLFTVERRVSLTPLDDLESGSWEACTPQTAADFSAVGYFFGRKLYNDLNVPIGLIHSSWGGTIAETWMSLENVSNVPDFEETAQRLSPEVIEQEMKVQQASLADLTSLFPALSNPAAVEKELLWKSPDTDISSWKTATLPAAWETFGWPEVDGVFWFSKTVTVPAGFSGDATLYLGQIDDSDQTWVNGELVGETWNKYDAPRVYSLKPGVLKAGKNVIVVRVTDTGGGGGIYGQTGVMRLEGKGLNISLDGEWQYRPSPTDLTKGGGNGMSPNSRPTLLYNGMIKALVPYAMRGAIWYQGESNAGRAYQYRALFPALIQDWRSQWGTELNFYFVQLANYMDANDQPIESGWAELREAQAMTLSLPKTGMAVTIDIGEAGDIHPRNKQDVGLRLALNALHTTYGKEIVFSGPTYQSMEVKGNEIWLSFTNTGTGLVAHDRYGYLKSFAIAGNDKEWHWAQARIVGDKVVVSSPEVLHPVAARYGWANNPEDANFYNKQGLPASPFRTDTWPGLTKGVK